MNFCLVTGLFNVKAKTNAIVKRSGKMYVHLIKYLYDLDIPIFIYADSSNIGNLPLKDNVHIIKKEIEELEMYKYIKDNDKLNIQCTNNYIYGNIFYFCVINSKIDLLKETSDYIKNNNLYPESKHLVWIDAGISHVGTIPKNQFMDGIRSNTHADKITVVMITATSSKEVENVKEFLQVDRGKIAAGLSIIPISDIDWYAKELHDLNVKTINEYNIFCMEEQLIAVISVKYENKFEYIFSHYWMLPNLINISNRIETVIKNLEYCRLNGIIDIGYKVLMRLLDSISYGKSTCISHDIHEILYNGQIISYYKDKELCKKLGLFIGFLYYNKHDAKGWFGSRFDNVKSNLSFSNLDLLDPTQFAEDIVLKIDDTDILWNAL